VAFLPTKPISGPERFFNGLCELAAELRAIFPAQPQQAPKRAQKAAMGGPEGQMKDE